MKNSKKNIITVTVAVMMMGALTACGQVRGTCEACGEHAKLYELTTTTEIFGVSESESFRLCKDCADEAIDEIEEQEDAMGVDITYSCEPIEK